MFIHTLERTDGAGDLVGDEVLLRLRVVCSKGTYIRSLAADIGRRLGCGAYLKELRRIRSGCFSVEDSLSGEILSLENVREAGFERRPYLSKKRVICCNNPVSPIV